MPISGKKYIWEERARYVPEEPGVYTLYDKDEVLIYIGKSANLRETFTHYLKTSFSDNLCKREAKFYLREITPKSDERLNELLGEFRQQHGVLPKCNLSSDFSQTAEIPSDPKFHFYEDIGRPLNEVANNLQGFEEKVRKVSIMSLEFHQNRGDFAKWIRNVLKDVRLAQSIEKIDKIGKELREELLNVLCIPEKVTCPNCGAESDPIKTWKMAGRPSKTGEKTQLTIGHYRCSDCNKTFRKVLKKEKIRIA